MQRQGGVRTVTMGHFSKPGGCEPAFHELHPTRRPVPFDLFLLTTGNKGKKTTGFQLLFLKTLGFSVMTGGGYTDPYICQNYLNYPVTIGESYCTYLSHSDF